MISRLKSAWGAHARIAALKQELADARSAGVIEFFCRPEDRDVIPEPIAAAKRMPDWYKKIPPLVQGKGRDHFGGPGFTAKKCLPLIDAMTRGWIIPLYSDVNVRADGKKFFEIGPTPTGPVIQDHPIGQLGGATSPTYPGPALKFINRWFMRTPPGWSTLFVAPLNNDERRFSCLSAVVDTDVYPAAINFPAVWLAGEYDGVIKAGTPLVTAIPFRRVDAEMKSVVRTATAAEIYEIERIRRVQQTRTGYYTQELRCPR